MRLEMFDAGGSVPRVRDHRMSVGDRVVIGAAGEGPFALPRCGCDVLVAVEAVEGGARVTCPESEARGVWVLVSSRAARRPDRTWTFDVTHLALATSVPLDDAQGRRVRHIRSESRHARVLEDEWAFARLTADPTCVPGAWPDARFAFAWVPDTGRRGVVVTGPAALFLDDGAGEPGARGRVVWIDPIVEDHRRGSRLGRRLPPRAASIRAGLPDASQIRAAATLDALCDALDPSGRDRCVAFALDAERALHVMRGADPERDAWWCPTPDGHVARRTDPARWLRDDLDDPDGTGYLPLLVGPDGAPFAMVSVEAAGTRVGLVFPLFDGEQPMGEYDAAALDALTKLPWSARPRATHASPWNDAPVPLLAPGFFEGWRPRGALDPSAVVAGRDGAAALALGYLDEAVADARVVEDRPELERALAAALAMQERDVAGALARAALPCIVKGLGGPTTFADAELALRAMLLHPWFPRPGSLVALTARLADVLHVPHQRRPAGWNSRVEEVSSRAWRQWFEQTAGDARYGALSALARLVARVALSSPLRGMDARVLDLGAASGVVAAAVDPAPRLALPSHPNERKALCNLVELRADGESLLSRAVRRASEAHGLHGTAATWRAHLASVRAALSLDPSPADPDRLAVALSAALTDPG